jgi:hypothetical protein
MPPTIPPLSTSELFRPLPKEQFWETSAHTVARDLLYNHRMATIRIYGKDS